MLDLSPSGGGGGRDSFRRNVEEEQRAQRVPSRVVSLDDVSQRMSQLSVRSPLRTAMLQVTRKKEEEKQARAINAPCPRHERRPPFCVSYGSPDPSSKPYRLLEFQPTGADDHRCLPPRQPDGQEESNPEICMKAAKISPARHEINSNLDKI